MAVALAAYAFPIPLRTIHGPIVPQGPETPVTARALARAPSPSTRSPVPHALPLQVRKATELHGTIAEITVLKEDPRARTAIPGRTLTVRRALTALVTLPMARPITPYSEGVLRASHAVANPTTTELTPATALPICQVQDLQLA